MTIRTPNWETGRILLPDSKIEDIREVINKAMPAKEDNRRNMNIEWPLLLGIASNVLYWQVEPHEKNEKSKEYLIARLKVRSALDNIKRWTENTGGAISGDIGFIHAYGPRGKVREKDYKEASKDVTKQFAMLKSIWYRDTKEQDLKKVLEHPAHEKILGLGSTILPLIFKEVKEDRGWWFTTLKIITNENPETLGQTLEEKKAAWLAWEKVNEQNED